MRRYVLGITTALSTFSLGLSLPALWSMTDSRAAIETTESRLDECHFDITVPVSPYNACGRVLDGCPLNVRLIVISIPTDNELYLGKDKVTLAEIPDKVRRLLDAAPLQEKVAFIKAADFVTYGTVVSTKERLQEAGITRVGFVRKRRIFKQEKSN